MTGVYNITPVPAPRMVRSDVWAKRPRVVRYFEFRDECRRQGMTLPDSSHIVFILPMPPSWSVKKRLAMDGATHHQRPDIDNMLKSCLDAVYGEDCHIHDIRATKYWGKEGQIIISPM